MSSEKILKVIDAPTITWFSPFYVHSLVKSADGSEAIVETIVETVDVYTYLCTRCAIVDRCLHTDAVRKHVVDAIERRYS